LRIIGSIALIAAIASLPMFLRQWPASEAAFAQGTSEDAKKGAKDKDKKSSSSGFEDDQSAMCLYATRQANALASIIDSYSRRLGACVTSNPNFRGDCSADFARVRQSYSQYELAVGSVRNYCK
jgi:hypothetical protein